MWHLKFLQLIRGFYFSDTSGNVSEQARVYWDLPEAVEASVTPSCGLDRSQRSYEVRKLEKVSSGSGKLI